MAKVSRDSASHVNEFDLAIDRSEELDGYSVSFVTIKKTHDLAPLLAKIPGGNCACPHWGYVISGRVTVRYPGHEEVLEPGDAFYLPPGHAPEAEAGTELVQFRPAEDMAALMAAMRSAMAG